MSAESRRQAEQIRRIRSEGVDRALADKERKRSSPNETQQARTEARRLLRGK